MLRILSEDNKVKYVCLPSQKQVRSVFVKKCLDIIITDTPDKQQSQLFGCHGSGLNQFFAFASNGQIITIEERFCTGILKDGVSVGTVTCSVDDESQFWKYDEIVRCILTHSRMRYESI